MERFLDPEFVKMVDRSYINTGTRKTSGAEPVVTEFLSAITLTSGALILGDPKIKVKLKI